MDAAKMVPWFGSNTKLAKNVGQILGPLRWCGVPFVGGGSELKYIQTKIGVANDLHRLVINLYRVISDTSLVKKFCETLMRTLNHYEVLSDAQDVCRKSCLYKDSPPDFEVAVAYFISSWMTRKGCAGLDKELDLSFIIRWTPGSPPTREMGKAICAISDWHKCVFPWSFINRNVFDFLPKVRDLYGFGIYVDAPWPGLGDGYKHGFTDENHRQLAEHLSRFKKTRVLIRFGEHPLIRELYCESRWGWLNMFSQNSGRNKVDEVLIANWKITTEGLL